MSSEEISGGMIGTFIGRNRNCQDVLTSRRFLSIIRSNLQTCHISGTIVLVVPPTWHVCRLLLLIDKDLHAVKTCQQNPCFCLEMCLVSTRKSLCYSLLRVIRYFCSYFHDLYLSQTEQKCSYQ